MIVEGFLGVPALDVGADGLVWGNIDGEWDGPFVELTSLHVEVCDFYCHACYG